MISYKCYSNPHVLMMRSNASKNSSRGFQVSSEISFLISVQKNSPDIWSNYWHDIQKNFVFGTKRAVIYKILFYTCIVSKLQEPDTASKYTGKMVSVQEGQHLLEHSPRVS